MFIIKFIRYLQGYVTFFASGAFVERFLNLAARSRIPIWDSKKTRETYSGKTSAKSYKKLRVHARKTGIKMRVIEKHGLPFKRYKYRKRTGLLTGMVIFTAFVVFTSLFIWRIEVGGNVKVSERVILSALEDIGVTTGIFRSSIDVRNAERRILLAIDDLAWAALNIKGSTIYVEVRESDPKPPVVNPNEPCNVVAKRSGQIHSMLVYDGQPMRSVGDAVMEGEILASGITEDRYGQNLFKHARAKVMARVEHKITVDIPLDHKRFEETGVIKSRSYFHLFNWDLPLFIPLKIKQPYHVDRSQSFLNIAGTQLPVGIFSEKYVLMREVGFTLTEEQAKQEAMKQLAILQQIELDKAEILEKTPLGSLKDGSYTLTTTYICNMDIAQEKQILKGE